MSACSQYLKHLCFVSLQVEILALYVTVHFESYFYHSILLSMFDFIDTCRFLIIIYLNSMLLFLFCTKNALVN